MSLILEEARKEDGNLPDEIVVESIDISDGCIVFVDGLEICNPGAIDTEKGVVTFWTGQAEPDGLLMATHQAKEQIMIRNFSATEKIQVWPVESTDPGAVNIHESYQSRHVIESAVCPE